MRLDKKILMASLLAFLAGVVIFFVLWLASLISWWLVFAIISFSLIAPAYACVRIWCDEDCYDLEDFWLALTEPKEETKQNNNSIFNDDDYRKYP